MPSPRSILLLVDVSAADRAVLRALLGRAGCEAAVVELPGAAAALAWLREHRIASNTALMILVDLDTAGGSDPAARPPPDGEAFLAAFAELRVERADLQPCVVTVMSGTCSPEAMRRTQALPFVWRHLVKMPGVDALRDLLRQASLCSTDAYEAIL